MKAFSLLGSNVVSSSLHTPLSVSSNRTQLITGTVDADIFGTVVPMGSVTIQGETAPVV